MDSINGLQRLQKPDSDQTDTAKTKTNGRTKRYYIILLMSFILVSTYWSIISLIKYYYFQATIFDLGVSMESLWSVTHMHWTIYQLFFHFDYQGVVFLLFPLQYAGYPTMLIFQSVLIGSGSIAVFLILEVHGINKRDSVFISVAYLLYFPLSGMTWFDFHFQSLFVPIFLFGYLLYVKKRYFSASLLFLISGIVRFPYVFFPLLFWIIVLFWEKKILTDKKLTIIAIVNIILLLSILLSSYYLLKNGYIQTHITGEQSPLGNIDIKILTIVIIFLPVLFLPILSRKWLLFLVPFIGLMFIANNPIFEFPYLFELQYSASYVPFIFLGVIDGLCIKNRRERLKKFIGNISKVLNKTFNFKNKGKMKIPRAATLLLIAAICSTLVFQSLGPISLLSQDGITFGSVVHYNNKEWREFKFVSYLIPKNCQYVLIQNNLPQFLPGPAGINIRTPGFIGPNITMSEIINNSFPWEYGSFSLTTRINFVLGDSGTDQWYTQSMVPGFPSMLNLTNDLIASGYYGVLAKMGTFYVVERGYSGPPITDQSP